MGRERKRERDSGHSSPLDLHCLTSKNVAVCFVGGFWTKAKIEINKEWAGGVEEGERGIECESEGDRESVRDWETDRERDVLCVFSLLFIVTICRCQCSLHAGSIEQRA